MDPRWIYAQLIVCLWGRCFHLDACRSLMGDVSSKVHSRLCQAYLLVDRKSMLDGRISLLLRWFAVAVFYSCPYQCNHYRQHQYHIPIVRFSTTTILEHDLCCGCHSYWFEDIRWLRWTWDAQAKPPRQDGCKAFSCTGEPGTHGCLILHLLFHPVDGWSPLALYSFAFEQSPYTRFFEAHWAHSSSPGWSLEVNRTTHLPSIYAT